MAILTSSPYYPYEKIQNYGTMPEMGKLPKIVRDYLMDMPMQGYIPPDNNEYPRCALMKYLYYDVAKPLDEVVPTTQQKLSIVFDPNIADAPPTDKKWRIFTQPLIAQAQTNGATIMRITMGRTKPISAYESIAAFHIVYLTNSAYEAKTKAVVASRTFEMANLTLKALAGVNFGVGTGTVSFNTQLHPDCGISPVTDEYENVGYRITLALSSMGTNMPME